MSLVNRTLGLLLFVAGAAIGQETLPVKVTQPGSAPMTGLVVLLKFKDQEGRRLPPSQFVSAALNLQISDYYGHATGWRVKPMVFIVTEYFTPSKSIHAYDWWSKQGSWENHFALLREVAEGIANGSIKVRAQDGTLEPVNLRACTLTPDGKVASVGTTYFVDSAGSGGVPGRANGNPAFWPQAPEVSAAIATKFGCRLGSYSSGFVVGTYGSYDDPGSVDVGAQIHEIGHEFLHWPDISGDCYGYSDWEIVKRISTVNKTGPSGVIRELNEVPDGSTVSVSIGDWDVWGFKNVGNPHEFIVFENAAAKGYTSSFGKKHPDKNLLVFRLDTRQQTQVNVTDLATATWADSTPVGFNIESVSAPGDVMSFKLRNSVLGTARDCGTAGDVHGYPVELYERAGLHGRVGAFGTSKYFASWLPTMGIEPGVASSVRILPGYKVTLCEGRRLEGRTCVLSNPGDRVIAFDLAAHQFDKKTSSLLVEKLPGNL